MSGAYWTSRELKILRKHYRQSPMAEIAKQLNRTEQAVRMKGSELKLRRMPPLWHEGLRWCNKCQNYKKPNEFHPSAQKQSHRHIQCKSCFAEWFQNSRERIYKNGKKSRSKPEAKIRRQKYNKANASKMEQYKRNHRYKKDYGISLNGYEQMFHAQNGLCAVCKKPESFNGRRLAVDHDHQTDSVRGLLCHRCNMMLGAALDVPETLESAAAYLRRHKINRAKVI